MDDGFHLGNLGAQFPSAATLFVVADIADTYYNLYTTRANDSWWRYGGTALGYNGAFRRVYPGFLQLTGFITMNTENHLNAHKDYFNHLIEDGLLVSV